MIMCTAEAHSNICFPGVGEQRRCVVGRKEVERKEREEYQSKVTVRGDIGTKYVCR